MKNSDFPWNLWAEKKEHFRLLYVQLKSIKLKLKIFHEKYK